MNGGVFGSGALWRALALTLLLAGPASAQQAADTVAPEAKTGDRSRSRPSRPSARWSSRPIRWPPRQGSKCCAPAATRPMRSWRCRLCSAWSSRNPPAWAAALSSSGTTARPANSPPSTAARPRPPRRRRICSSATDGKPLEFFDAVVGGRSVGVPGVPRLLETVHRRYGTRPWQSLFEPAIKLAEQGFAISPRLAAHGRRRGRAARRGPRRARLFLRRRTDRHCPPGTCCAIRTMPRRLRAIGDGGADAFYNGPIAGKDRRRRYAPPDQSRPADAWTTWPSTR